MPYSGKYRPTNSKKYRGNIDKIYYRSLWERKFMVYCDRNEKIIEWGSEEVVIPYRSPIDGKLHRYFPDFYIKFNQTLHSMSTTPNPKEKNTKVFKWGANMGYQ